MSWRFWEKEASPTAADPTHRCGFCGKSRMEVQKLIAGPGIAICDECIALCVGLMDQARPTLPDADSAGGLGARLVAQLPGRAAATYALERLLRAHLQGPDGPPAALLVGPRGAGKTALLDALGAAAGIPAQRFEAGGLSATGYVGDDIETFLGALHGRDPDLAPRGLLMLDNLQHLAARGHTPGITLDVRGSRAQRQVVRLLDRRDAIAHLGPRHPGQKLHSVQTRGLMIVAAVTLDPLPDSRAGILEALQALGLEPALLRRLPVLLPMPRRDEKALAAVARVMAGGLGLDPAGLDLAAMGTRAAGHADGAWVIRRALRRAVLDA